MGEGQVDEVMEGQERIENPCTWKIGRPIGSRSPVEQCGVFHGSVYGKIQKLCAMLPKGTKDWRKTEVP